MEGQLQMNYRFVIFVLVLLGFETPASMAQLSTSDQAAIDAYRSAISLAENAASIGSIENAFSAVAALNKALLRMKEDRIFVLESLSDAEFLRLERELPGVMMNRVETVYVEANIGYFARLAGAKGDDADRAFFEALNATYQYSVWPVYIEQQTDYSGCVRFGSMSLVETYRTWSAFRRKYPDRYVARATSETDHVLDELTSGTCACGDAAGIMQELERFRTAFPASPASSEIDKRLEALRTDRSNIRTNCRSG